MECLVRRQLETDYRIADRKWKYFYSPEYKANRGMSDRKSKQEAKVARTELDDAIEKIRIHELSCEVCSKK